MPDETNLGTGGAISKPAPIVNGADSYDIDALKAFSEAETAELEKQQPELFKAKPSKKQKQEEEPEEVAQSDGEDEAAPELPEEDAEAEREADKPESKEEAEELPEEVGDEEVDTRSWVVAKAGDKSLKIPKGALVDIKVNGKLESLPLKEVLNRASGALHIERETSRLGRERKALEADQSKWREKAQVVNDNMQILQELCETGTPEEVAAYYAHIAGKDPNTIFNSIIENALKYAQQYEGLTEREIALQNENRKFRLQQLIESKRSQRAQAQAQAEQQRKSEAERVSNLCKRKNITGEQFSRYSDELARMSDAELQEMGIEITPESVTDYIVKRRLEEGVQSAITAVNKALLKDSEFRDRIAEAVTVIEATRKRVMSPREVQDLVKFEAERDKKALSDTLSRKADRAVKAGATSKNGKSQKQDKDEGPLTLRQHWDNLRGI